MEKTFFFGNGLNYLSDSAISWESLLLEYMGDDKFDMTFLPNLMTYERIRLNWNIKNGHLKNEIAERFKKQQSNEYYIKILNSNFTNYITTNYDYTWLEAFEKINKTNTKNNKSTEQLYSIRRHKLLKDSINNVEKKVWSIHGEVDHPKSIMLGMNHYCGSVGKINQYLKGEYDFTSKQNHLPILPIEEKLATNKFDSYSWIELFFSSNLYIAGFGLDFSEIDLWWILTVRARLKAESKVNNKIYYYTKPIDQVTKEIELEKRKRETLKSLYVEIIEIRILSDYKGQWDEIISHMKSN